MTASKAVTELYLRSSNLTEIASILCSALFLSRLRAGVVVGRVVNLIMCSGPAHGGPRDTVISRHGQREGDYSLSSAQMSQLFLFPEQVLHLTAQGEQVPKSLTKCPSGQ